MPKLASIPELQYRGKPALAPIEEDLQRLYDLITFRRSMSVLEFGCGYSTIIIAQAITDNKAWFETSQKITKEYRVGMSNFVPWHCSVVDSDKAWMKEVGNKIPKNLAPVVDMYVSDCHAGTFNGQLCSYYSMLPDILPDFIYMDGPDQHVVSGNVNGLGFKDKRHPMAADILLMEPTLLPGATILVDGRVLNVIFLRNNFKRKWVLKQNNDYSIFRLME
ncbi:MAG TPA: hypothetical protein ENH82_16370 [bacterium]|nr:hypothetical protein [bacterium]